MSKDRGTHGCRGEPWKYWKHRRHGSFGICAQILYYIPICLTITHIYTYYPMIHIMSAPCMARKMLRGRTRVYNPDRENPIRVYHSRLSCILCYNLISNNKGTNMEDGLTLLQITFNALWISAVIVIIQWFRSL